jgi:hypothetical protein
MLSKQADFINAIFVPVAGTRPPRSSLAAGRRNGQKFQLIRWMIFAPRTAFIAAAVLFIDGRPGNFFGFFFGNAFFAVTVLDMFRLTFLFVGVFVLITSRHISTPLVRNLFYKMLADRFRKALLSLAKRVPPLFVLISDTVTVSI